MSTELRRVLNYLSRWWWVWAFAALMQGLTMVTAVTDGSPERIHTVIFIMILTNYLENTGWLRVIYTLPLSRRDVGRLRWWSRVGIPGVMLSAATLISLLAIFPMKTAPSLQPVWGVLVRIWAALGLFMLAQNGPRRFGDFTFYSGLGFVALIGTWMAAYLMPFSTAPFLTIPAAGFGIASAVYSFAYADRYVLSRPVDRRGKANEISKLTYGGISGWLVVAKQQAIFSFMMVLGIIALQYSFQNVIMKGDPAAPPILPAVVLAIFGMIYAMILAPAARVYRVLPLTATRLASDLMLVLLLPVTVVAAILYSVGTYLPAFRLPVSSVLLLPLIAANLPIGLRFGMRSVITGFCAGLLMLGLDVGMIFAAMVRAMQSPLFIDLELGAGVLFIVVCYAWTRYELANGTHAYRPRPTPIAAFGGGLLPR